jgi:nucleotide-binding universal stress UspA family protein
MFKHLLIPLDGSEHAERALPYAVEIANEQARITLLTIVEIPITPFTVSPSPPVLPQEQEDYETYRIHKLTHADQYLKKIAFKLKDRVENVETYVQGGNDPAGKILDFCGEHAVDVIVMATRGYSGLTRWIMGSVTQKVLQASSCPVLIIPHH